MTTDTSSATPPRQYWQRATLTSGLHVAIRPLLGSDGPEIAAGFAQLSEETRFRRFMAGKPCLTPGDVRYFVDGVDQHDHIGLVLVWPRTSRSDVIIGDAHAIRLRNEPDTADVAVTVADEIHGCGAGRLLIAALADAARTVGIQRFSATMLATNTASHRMLCSVGTLVEHRCESGMREVTVEL